MGARPTTSLWDRFWAKVDKGVNPDRATHWRWTGYRYVWVPAHWG